MLNIEFYDGIQREAASQRFTLTFLLWIGFYGQIRHSNIDGIGFHDRLIFWPVK